MAQKPCKVYIRVTRSQPSICLCTPSSAVPPTIVTSWLLQASWPAQSLPHSPPILRSVPYMSNVWHPIQWVTRPGLTFRTKCQSLWKMQTGRQRVSPCSQVKALFHSALLPAFSLRSSSWQAVWAWPSSCTTLSNGSSHISSFKTPCLFHVILLLVILHTCLPLLGNIFCLSIFKYSFSFSLNPCQSFIFFS